MRFTHYDLGNLSRGTAIEVTLQGNAANVRLLDSSNSKNTGQASDTNTLEDLSVVHLPDWWYRATVTGMQLSICKDFAVKPVHPSEFCPIRYHLSENTRQHHFHH